MFSAVPVKTGSTVLVMLSVDDVPVSEAVAKSGEVGATGAMGSMVIDSAGDAADALPAGSLAVVVKLWTPASMVGMTKVQTPSPSATVVPISVAPS